MTRLPERRRRGPLGALSRMGNLLDDLEQEFDFGFGGRGYGRTDIYEHDGQLHYELELPGVSKEDINARIEDDQLIVEGEIQRRDDVSTQNYLRMQRRYGRFQKSFTLPDEVEDVQELRAEFRDGILKISVPLRESLQGEVIDIDIE